MNKAIRKKHRISIWLKIFIVWQSVVSVVGLLIYSATTGYVLFRFVPKWVFLLDIAVFIGFIPCMIAIWKYKRWGVYGATALYAIKMFEALWLYQIWDGFQNLSLQ